MNPERYLLDTNVVSQLARKQPDPGVIGFLSQFRESPDALFLSVLTIGEIHRGIVKLERRGDSDQAAKLRRWHRQIQDDFSDHMLPIDGNTAIIWGAILATTDSTNGIDKLIAATALHYDLTLVTRNVSHIRGTGARFLNPFAD